MSEFEQEKQQSTENEKEKFSKIIVDFTKDVLNTFPEFTQDLNEHLKNVITSTDDEECTSINYLFEYCKSVYPEKFFDILYQSPELFDSEDPIYLLPGIDFKFIWKSDISDSTRETIWKYLQLLLFTLVSDIDDEKSFGDTAKLFEAINNDEFKSKLEDTIKDMHNIFNSSDNSGGEGINIPDADEMHSHITGMLDGKLGRLAREIAEETAGELDLDLNENAGINDVYDKLFKNPTKLMGLVKNVGSKLDTKIKSGDIKESELMEEATELMKKMKDMPGMDNMQEMLSKMGMGSGGLKEMMKGMKGFDSKAMKGKAGEMNMNNFTAMMEKNMNDSKRREKILQDLERKKKEKEDELKRQQELMNNYDAVEAEKNIRELLEMEDLDKKNTAASAEKPKKKKKKKKTKN
tara:strand:+ start:3493 stop:4713 length:1221 start_codon:yes stop_codon:yes gene_type:complete